MRLGACAQYRARWHIKIRGGLGGYFLLIIRPRRHIAQFYLGSLLRLFRLPARFFRLICRQ